MIWRRSSTCEAGACAEVAFADGQVLIRESRSGNLVRFTRAEWEAFTAGVKAGDFDEENHEQAQ